MSVWTHVAAVFRLDFQTFSKPEETEEAIREFLGHVLTGSEEDEKLWETCKFPQGSEGSLQYELVTDPDEDSAPRHVLTVYGDLRDYDLTKAANHAKLKAMTDFFDMLSERAEKIPFKGRSGALTCRQAVMFITSGGYSRVLQFR